ncbi:hypothetical protein EDD18DRAFT_1108826 [Armillaria luteobubalina]|uniref:Uncharacterized protein n=1 Tax=Armillaria luteobubalina TaxID=153913 RepID=A0AA39UL38_9AGAR|nr:hypothetical protein EDD18DRAFT_1108826 [Armillaria luteobubalina]
MRIFWRETKSKNSLFYEHYTIRGYDHAGWMVVMLEMKAGNAGRWFEYGPCQRRRWLRNARNGRPLASKHFFRHREHVEAWGIWDRVSCLSAALDIPTLRSQWISIAIEVPVEDLFVGYMIAQPCKPEMTHRQQTEDRFKWVIITIIYMFVLPTYAGWIYYYIQKYSLLY